RSANRLYTDLLRVGQLLWIPAPTATTASRSGAARQNIDDLYLLARVVYAEARGEPYVGQVAVAAVVLNRLASPLFPNTLAGVIYQPGAFTAVADGQINLQPNATAIQAARQAMAGWDPTGGALYYWNPARTTSAWVWSRTIVARIGSHIFAL
ncbi:MAG: cell wall hydrolase, partial [Anaerolineae bacterium]